MYHSKIAILLLSLLAITLASCQSDDEGDGMQASIVNVGDKMPSFTLTAADGSQVSSDKLSGKVYLLNFFDTECPDCQKELPVLQQIYSDYLGVVDVYNVPRSQSVSEVNAYWSGAGLSMPVYTSSDSQLYYKFAKSGIPRTYVVDGNGEIKAMFDDSPVADYKTINGVLQSLLPTDVVENVNLNIQMKFNAVQGIPDENATSFECYVSKVDFYFFDPVSKKLVQKTRIENPDVISYSAGPYYQNKMVVYQINNVQIKPGKYNIFAIANYDGVPETVTDQDTFLNQIDTESYKNGVMLSIPTEGPIMTSPATEHINLDLTSYKGKSYVLTVSLIRSLAKIQLRQYTGDTNRYFTLYPEGKDSTTDWYARITITNYKYVNMNKCYYLFQHYDYLPTWSTESTFEFPDNFLVKDDYKNDEYVIDPHFYEKLNTTEAVDKFAEKYYNWYGNFTLDNMNTMPASKDPAKETSVSYRWILENTCYKDNQKNGYSPGVVLQANVVPKSVKTWDPISSSWVDEPAQTFKPTIYLYNFQFYSTIADINRVSGLSLEDKTYTDAELAVHHIKQCKATDKSEYETFYTYWIRENVSAVPMTSMNYGVVRNRFYNLCIVGVSGLGTSTVTPETLRNNYPNSYVDVASN